MQKTTELNLVFPKVPEIIRNDDYVVTYIPETKTVEMPLWFWLNMVDYCNLVNEQQKIYETWKLHSN